MLVLLSLFMLLWAPSLFSKTIPQELSAPEGGSVLFRIQLPTNVELNSIFWSKDGMQEGQMLAIARPDSFKVIDSSFRDRLRSQEPGMSLNLSDLRVEDSGIYKATIFNSGNTTSMSFQLRVNEKSKVEAGSFSGRAQGKWNNICLMSFGVLISYIINET